MVSPGSVGHHTVAGQLHRPGQQWDGGRVDSGPQARGIEHRVQVAEETEPRHIGGRVDPRLHHGLSGPVVQVGHDLDGGPDLLVAGSVALDGRGDDAEAEGLGQVQGPTRAGGGVADETAAVREPGHGHAVLGLEIGDGVSPHDGDAGLGRHRRPPLQDPNQHVEREVVDRPPHEVQREDRPGPHRIDIA